MPDTNRESVFLGFSCIITVLLIFIPARVSADTVFLSNGDIISGTVIELSKGQLTIDTEYGKGISIDWKRVAAMETEALLFIEFQDEEKIRAKIMATREAWRLEDEAGAVHPVTKDDIQRFSRKRPKYWTLEFDLAYQLTSGNTKSDDFRIAFDVKKKRPQYELIFAGSYARAATQEEVSADRWDLLFKYDHLMTQKIYRRGFFFFERDRVREIKRRFQTGPAIGYKFYDSDTMGMSSDIGTLREETRYESGASDSEFKGLWNIDFFYVFPSDMKIEEAFRWIQGFDNRQDYEITSETSGSVPITGGFFLKASVIERYDNQPEPDLKKNDVTFILSLSYRTNF